MDRKSSSIFSGISELKKDVIELKSTQPFGYDSSGLKMVTSNDAYDITATIASGDRYSFDIFCYESGVFGYHVAGYNQILFQIWVNNMSTPYYGESSGIGVFTPINTSSPYAPGNDMLSTEMINSSGSSITIFIKAYAITTYTNGVVI